MSFQLKKISNVTGTGRMLNDVIRIPSIVRTNSLFVHTNNRTPHACRGRKQRTVDIVAKLYSTKRSDNGVAYLQLRLERVSAQTGNRQATTGERTRIT